MLTRRTATLGVIPAPIWSCLNNVFFSSHLTRILCLFRCKLLVVCERGRTRGFKLAKPICNPRNTSWHVGGQSLHSIQGEIRELGFRSITRGFSLLDILLVEVSRNICRKIRHAHFDASFERNRGFDKSA
jgi:hypothetical protein